MRQGNSVENDQNEINKRIKDRKSKRNSSKIRQDAYDSASEASSKREEKIRKKGEALQEELKRRKKDLKEYNEQNEKIKTYDIDNQLEKESAEIQKREKKFFLRNLNNIAEEFKELEKNFFANLEKPIPDELKRLIFQFFKLKYKLEKLGKKNRPGASSVQTDFEYVPQDSDLIQFNSVTLDATFDLQRREIERLRFEIDMTRNPVRENYEEALEKKKAYLDTLESKSKSKSTSTFKLISEERIEIEELEQKLEKANKKIENFHFADYRLSYNHFFQKYTDYQSNLYDVSFGCKAYRDRSVVQGEFDYLLEEAKELIGEDISSALLQAAEEADSKQCYPSSASELRTLETRFWGHIDRLTEETDEKLKIYNQRKKLIFCFAALCSLSLLATGLLSGGIAFFIGTALSYFIIYHFAPNHIQNRLYQGKKELTQEFKETSRLWQNELSLIEQQKILFFRAAKVNYMFEGEPSLRLEKGR